MNLKIFAITFATVILAELGDKTQLLLLSLSSKTQAWPSVLLGGASGLLVATVAAVAVGSLLGKLLPHQVLQVGSGIVFIVLGVLIILNRA